jgi:hypothetical protein
MKFHQIAAFCIFAVTFCCALTPSTAASSYFPKTNPLKLKISLQRTACLGSCPDYKVTLRGNGRVIFSTNISPADPVSGLHRRFAILPGVLFPGVHGDDVKPEIVAGLVQKFRGAHFFHLKNEYRRKPLDGPTYILTIDTGHGKKTVVDYGGDEVGMPKAVKRLEDDVDKVAGTDRWVRGGVGLIAWLEKRKFDFHSPEAAELAADGGMRDADEATLLALVDKGAPLENVYYNKAIGLHLIKASISRGHSELFRKLVSLGWLERLGMKQAGEIFADNAAGCSPELLEAAVAVGLKVDEEVPADSSYYGESQQGKTGLANLASTYRCDKNEDARVATARRYLALGADPNHRDQLGHTPIYGVENMELLNLLLSHGADAKAKDKNGHSVIFGSWSDAIIFRLLEAGASPVGRYVGYDNKTLAEVARDQHMHMVKKWLAAHPNSRHK